MSEPDSARARIEAAIQRANDQYCANFDSVMEMDDNPGTVVGDDAIWVQVWVRIPNEDIDEELKKGD